MSDNVQKTLEAFDLSKPSDLWDFCRVYLTFIETSGHHRFPDVAAVQEASALPWGIYACFLTISDYAVETNDAGLMMGGVLHAYTTRLREIQVSGPAEVYARLNGLFLAQAPPTAGPGGDTPWYKDRRYLAGAGVVTAVVAVAGMGFAWYRRRSGAPPAPAAPLETVETVFAEVPDVRTDAASLVSFNSD